MRLKIIRCFLDISQKRFLTRSQLKHNGNIFVEFFLVETEIDTETDVSRTLDNS